MMGATSKANQTSRTTSNAVAFAREQIEGARSQGFDNLVHLTGVHLGDPNVVVNMFDPDATGPLAPEQVYYSATGIASLVATKTSNGITFTARSYVTDAPSEAKRVTVLVNWHQQNSERTTSLSTLIAPPASPLSAAADAFAGQSSSGSVTPVVSSRARRGGGRQEAAAGSFSPQTGWNVTGASTSAEVEASVRHTATVGISSATLSQPISANNVITIVASGLSMTLEALPGGNHTTTMTGTVTVNGVQFVNPSPGTEIPIGTWKVALNSEMAGADGSSSASFIRVIGPAGQDLRLGWAWVSSVTPW